MATKKKTRSTKAAKTPAKKADSKLTDVQEMAVRAARLVAGMTDGTPAAIGELIREKLSLSKAELARIQSGDLLPSEEQAALLKAFLDANAGVNPGEAIKDRQPNEDEERHLADVQELADLTAMPAWGKLVLWMAAEEAAIKGEFETCKSGEVKELQGRLRFLRDLQHRVLAPAEEINKFPIFKPRVLVKVDRKKLTVTVGARS